MLSVVLLACSILVPSAPDSNERARHRAFDLVAELGNPAYRVREKAARELVRLGAAAVDALRKGVSNPDAEVSERCKRLLPQALDDRLQEQIAVFLANLDGPIPQDLPGLQRWLKLAGQSKESRALYAAMVKEQRRVLIDVEAHPQNAPLRYQAFCREVYDRARDPMTGVRADAVGRSEVLAFLFLGSDPHCRQGTTGNFYYGPSSLFLSSTHLTGLISGATASDAAKKVFLGWLENERHLLLRRRGYAAAANADLKEAGPLALQVAADKALAPAARAYPLIAAARLFRAEDVKDLEKLMDDKTIVGRTSINGEAHTAEMRDIALAIALQAAGREPADFGFDRLRNNPKGMAVSCIGCALSDKKRDEAFKKWREWKDKRK